MLRIPKNPRREASYYYYYQVWLVEPKDTEFQLRTVKGFWNTELLIETIIEHELIHKHLELLISFECSEQLDNIAIWKMGENKIPEIRYVSHKEVLKELYRPSENEEIGERN